MVGWFVQSRSRRHGGRLSPVCLGPLFGAAAAAAATTIAFLARSELQAALFCSRGPAHPAGNSVHSGPAAAVLAPVALAGSLGWQLAHRAPSGERGARTLCRAAAAAPSGGRNPYDVLGVSPSASMAAAKFAFRCLVKTYHPDVPGTGNAERFMALLWALEELSNAERRMQWAALASAAKETISNEPTPSSSWFTQRKVWSSSPDQDIISGDYEPPSKEQTRKRGSRVHFKEAGQTWDARRQRASGRLQGANDNSAKNKAVIAEEAAEDRELWGGSSRDRKRYKQKPRGRHAW